MGNWFEKEQPAIEEEQPPEIRVESVIHDFFKEIKKGSEAIESIKKKLNEYVENEKLRP